MKRPLVFLLKMTVSFSGFFAIFFLFRDRLGEVLHLLRSARPGLVLLAVAIYLAAFPIVTFRLKWILGVHKVHLPSAVLLYYNTVGQFFSLFLPSAIGGDVVKGYYLYKRSGEKMISFTSIFFDRLIGSLTVLSLAVAAMAFLGKDARILQVRYVVLGVFACFLALLAFFLSRRVARCFQFLSFLMHSKRLRDFLQHTYHRVNAFKHHGGVLAKAFLVSLAAQVCFISVLYLLAVSLRIDIPYLNFFLVVPIVTALSMAPSINGLGVRELGFSQFFGWFTSQEKALALSVLYLGLIYAVGFLFGFIYLIRDGFRPHVVREAFTAEEDFERMEEREL